MDRRTFLKTSSAACVGSYFSSLAPTLSLSAEHAEIPALTTSNAIRLGGLFGESYDMGLHRLALPPFDTNFVLADVNFNQERWFTNFSGDISGRFIEVTSLTSTKENPQPPCLPDVLAKITQYQKADGHYGAEVDWSKPMDTNVDTNDAVMMPILWGNGRLFLGLLAAWERFGDQQALDSAVKMGNFYIDTVIPRFCDPKRIDEYKRDSVGYASAYVTCVFHGMEGLVRCWRLTHDKKFLDAAVLMADFHEEFDVLPVRHSHGSISAHEALMMVYEETGEKRFLDRAIARWEAAAHGGYVNACGSVLEFFFTSNCTHDEGCSESDWLRLNLMLWRNTGNTRYLDFAERLLYNGYLANQWPTGGFGHRNICCDETGPFAWRDRAAESLWCCSFHCPLGLYEYKEYLAVADGDTIRYHFPVDFETPLDVTGQKWTVVSKSLDEEPGIPVSTKVLLRGPEGGSARLAVRVPDWCSSLEVAINGQSVAGKLADGYFTTDSPLPAGSELVLRYTAEIYLEDRKCQRIPLPETLPERMDGVALRYGPHALVSASTTAEAIDDVRLTVKDGKIQMPEGMATFAAMDMTQRGENHGFIFNVLF